MVRTPLARGLLTGKFPPGQPIPPEQQWRRPRGDQLRLRLARVEQVEANIRAADGELTAEELGRVGELHAAWRAEARW